MADPKASDILKLRTKKQILAYADKKGCRVVEGNNYIYVGPLKCVFDKKGKLQFVE